MVVAVDATAVRSPEHGIGTYVANLLKHLVEVEDANHYVTFMTAKAVSSLNTTGVTGKRASFCRVTANRPLRLLWERFLLPGAAARKGANLLWGCHNSLPAGKRCPQVVTVHDIGMLTLPHYYPASKVGYFRKAIAHAVAQADVVVAVSEFTASELVKHLDVPRARIRVVHNGVGPQFQPLKDPEVRQAVRDRYGIPERFIFSLGVPEPKKNLARLLDAYSTLKRREPSIPRLVIGGGRRYGWKNREIYSQAESMSESVVLTDFIAPADLPAVYAMADLFVFPTLYEGFGLPPLEALACGTPVLSSRVASIPEVLGEAAVLVDPGSTDRIAEGILLLLANSRLRAELRTRGLQQASRFTWRKAARSLVDVFSDAVEQAS